MYIEALHGLYWFCLFQLSIGEICWDCWFQSIFPECVIFPRKQLAIYAITAYFQHLPSIVRDLLCIWSTKILDALASLKTMLKIN